MCECLEYDDHSAYLCPACWPWAEHCVSVHDALQADRDLANIRKTQLLQTVHRLIGAIEDFYHTGETEYLSTAQHEAQRVVDMKLKRAILMMRFLACLRSHHTRMVLLGAIEDWRSNHGREDT